MKTLIWITFLSLSTQAQADEVSTSRNTYMSYVRVENEQITRLQNLMDQYHASVGAYQGRAYTPGSGSAILKQNELLARIREASQQIWGNSVRASYDVTEMDEKVNAKRQMYFQRLNNLAATDDKTLAQMKLPPEVLADIDFARATKGMNSQELDKRIPMFEGRDFGVEADLAHPQNFRKQVEGFKTSGVVELKTYSIERKLALRQGQLIRMQTPSGQIVQGEVQLVGPDGKVLITNEYPKALKENVPRLTGGRIVDLNQVHKLHVYSDKAKLFAGAGPDVELEVRFSKAQILRAVRENTIQKLAKANPDRTAIPRVIRTSVIDKAVAGASDLVADIVGVAH